MSMLSKVALNVPRVALEDYFWVLSGQPKSGKTSLFGDVCTSHFNNPNIGLLVAFEKGYSALSVNKVDIDVWTDFEELAEELVENKDTVPYRLLGLDTVDILYDRAVEQVIKEWNIKHPNKRSTDINGVGAKGNSDQGFGAGYDLVKKKIRGVLHKLRSAGFGFMAITHSKMRTIKQQDGQEFDTLQLSLNATAREIFVNDADFIVFIASEKVKVKGGGVDTQRYMYWRNNGFIEAGGRFTDVPERIEYDIDGFIDVFKNAVESSLKKSGVKDIKKLEKEQAQEKEAKATEFIANRKKVDLEDASPEELTEQIDALVRNMGREDKVKLAAQFKTEFNGVNNYKTLTSVDDLKKALEITKKVAGADNE